MPRHCRCCSPASLSRVGLAASASVVAGGFAWWRRAKSSGPEQPSDDALFSLFLPGGPQGYWCNGPLGTVTAKLMPIIEAGTYRTVGGMLDLRPDDDLLDIGEVGIWDLTAAFAKLLEEIAAKGETFYGRFPPKKQAA